MFYGTIGVACLSLSSCLMLPLLWIKDNNYIRKAYHLQYCSVSGAMLCLFLALLLDDFSLRYVVENSHYDLPAYLKFAALWGAHGGSWLLMIWLLLSWGYLAKCGDQPAILKAFAVIAALWTLGLIGMDSPFVVQAVFDRAPKTLNPLLQDVGMMIHPPVLLLGYVGALVPWICMYQGMDVNHLETRRVLFQQQLLSIAILSLGIMLGGWWSYRVLGWGGYWAWDPIEVVSLIPWLLQLVMLHAFKQQSADLYVLAFLTAWATTLCLLFARAGFIDSVHSFSQTHHVAFFFMGMMVLMSLIGLSDIKIRRATISQLSGLYHREFLFYAVLLLLSQILPVFNWFGAAFVIGQSFYVKLSIICLIVILKKWVKGLHAWARVALLTILLCIQWEWFWGALIVSMAAESLWKQRSYQFSMQMIHGGFLLMVIMIFLHTMNIEVQQLSLLPGESASVPFIGQLHYKDLHFDHDAQRSISKAQIQVVGEEMYTLYPSVAYYPTRDAAVAKPHIHLSFFKEVYMIVNEVETNGRVYIEVQQHSYIRYILFCCVIMIMGLVLYRKEQC